MRGDFVRCAEACQKKTSYISLVRSNVQNLENVLLSQPKAMTKKNQAIFLYLMTLNFDF